MTDELRIEDRVLDGDQLGPVQVEIQAGDTEAQVTIEDSVFDGNGSEVIIEVREDVAITGLDELTELTEDIEQAETRVNQAINSATSLLDQSRQQLDEFDNRVEEVRTLVDQAEDSQNAAATSEANAATSATNAATSAQAASNSETAAANSETAAEAARDVAITNRNQAQSFSSSAVAARNAAQAARDAAQLAEQGAEASETAAATSESNAATSESNAATSESNAATSESNANASRIAAQAAQGAAETAETNAGAAQTAAEAAQTAAETAETNAETAETNAANSAAAALASQQAAATSQSNAATSAANAATSETNASTSETNAANSETAAETAETNAEAAQAAAEAARDRAIQAETRSIAAENASAASQSAASASATGAANSATAASNSAAAALASENNAETSENNADASEAAALVSRNAAATSASNAATSASNASTSESNASTSETNAAASAATANTRATDAENARNAAQTAQGLAESARDMAIVAQDGAETAETNAETAETNAANSASAAATSATRAQEALDALRAGQVYRGTWNPNTGAYPDPDGSNSVWDVVVTTASGNIEFDNKTWEAGDRLLYVLANTEFVQIETGGAVRSVNGDTGAVVITADSIGAFSPTNLPTWNQVTGKPNVVINGSSGTVLNNLHINTLNNTRYLTLSRSGNTSIERVNMGLDDARVVTEYRNDEAQSQMQWRLISTDTEANLGRSSDREMLLNSNDTGMTLTLDGNRVFDESFLPTPNALNVWSKTEADSRYINVGERAADSALLAGVAAANYQLNTTDAISHPQGASFSTTTQNVTGVIAVKLPTSRNNSNTMMSFTVNVFNYISGQTSQFRIGGYNHTSGWTRTSAYATAAGKEFLVRFGNDGTRDIVYIGLDNEAWQYPQVTVTDVQLGFQGKSLASWRDGWDVTVGTDTASNVESTITTGIPYNTQHRPTLSELGALGATAQATDSAQLQGRSYAQVISDARDNLATLGRSYTKAEADARFLSIGGGTLTGDLIISKTNRALLRVDAGTNADADFIMSEDSRNHGFFINYRGSGDNLTRLGTRNANADVSFLHVARGSTTAQFQGHITTAATQSSVANSLTRRDFVESQVNTRLPLTGGVLTDKTSVDGTGTIGLSNIDNYWFRVGNSSTSLNFDPNEIWGSDDLNIGTFSGNLNLYYNGTRRAVLGASAFDVQSGELHEQGQRVYSPNNVPAASTIFRTSTVTKAVQTSTSWQTLLENSDFTQGSGVYIISVSYSSNGNGGSGFSQTYTGQLYWYGGQTNDDERAEIVLHNMGHHSGETIFLRTHTRPGQVLTSTVDIRCTTDHTGPVNYNVSLARII